MFRKVDFFRCLEENILITLQRSNVELELLSPLIILAAIDDWFPLEREQHKILLKALQKIMKMYELRSSTVHHHHHRCAMLIKIQGDFGDVGRGPLKSLVRWSRRSMIFTQEMGFSCPFSLLFHTLTHHKKGNKVHTYLECGLTCWNLWNSRRKCKDSFPNSSNPTR